MARRLSIVVVLAAVLGVGVYLAFALSQLYLFRPGFGGSYTYHLLFKSAPWAVLAAAALGVFFGASVEGRREPEIRHGKVLRHDEVAFLEHWSHAVSTLLLLGTGIYLGFLFFPRLVHTPQATGFVFNLHYVGVVVFLFSVFYHLTEAWLSGRIGEHLPEPGDFKAAIAHYAAKLSGRKEPPEGKYLASERLSYVGWIVGVGMMVVTGAIKVSAHVWSLPSAFMGGVTFLHDLFALLMLVMLLVHVVASSVVPWSWPLFRSMLTGYVPEEYVQKHHAKWYAELKEGRRGKEPAGKPVPEKPGVPVTP
ncbi:MAG: cytochrome b/b6 domain-containing protein [Bacillota bacterium]|nr:cytochrome b/b6 domain-containing protein [Bacillota bacterium]